jgi:hypothetical protein
MNEPKFTIEDDSEVRVLNFSEPKRPDPEEEGVIEIIPLKPILKSMKCPNCSEGYMKPTGMVLTSYPEQYRHYCDKCNCTAIYYNRYPLTSFISDV